MEWYGISVLERLGGQDIADFRGTAGTVTINSNETESVNQLIFNTDGYIIAGASSPALNIGGAATITTNVGTASITAALYAPGPLNIAGAGITSITGTTYVGGALTVAAGSTLSTNSLLGASQILNGGTIAYNLTGTTGTASTPLSVNNNSTIRFDQTPAGNGAATYNYGSVSLGANLTLDGQTNSADFYYGMPIVRFNGGLQLNNNVTLTVSGVNVNTPKFSTAANLLGGVSGPYTLTKAGNGVLSISTGSNYAGLLVNGGAVDIVDVAGMSSSSVTLNGGTLGLNAPVSSNGGVFISTIPISASGTSGLTIDQSGSTGATNYSLGALTLGTGTFSITQPNPGNFYYGQPTLAIGATTLTGNVALNEAGGTAGNAGSSNQLLATIGPVSGAYTITANTGNAELTIAGGGNYSGLIINGGIVNTGNAGALPTALLNLSGGTLGLGAIPGTVIASPALVTNVTVNSTIDAVQPLAAGQYGASGAATYGLGALNLGGNLSIVEPVTNRFYYGQPQVNFGATTLQANVLITETSGTAGGTMNTALGPITGPYTLTYSGTTLNILAGVGGNYAGLNVSAGTVQVNDPGGLPATLLTLSGGTLNLLMPAGKNGAVPATSVTANALVNINQPGSTGAANYSLGALTIGANALTLTLPAQGNYYYGLPSVGFSSATLTGNATFNTSGTAAGFVLTPTIGAISGTGFSVTKVGAANLTLNGSNTYTGGTNVSAGKLTFAAPGALPVYSNLTIGTGAIANAANYGANPKNNLFASSLSLAGTTGAWTSLLDLANNDLDVQNGSLVTLNDQVKQGFNAGAWNGSGGIVSTAAAASTSHLTALGVIQNSVDGTTTGAPLYGSGTANGTFDGANPLATDVLVKYTYYGDTNLDGKVDASDYSRIDNGFIGHLTGWFNGDFNYDGVVNGSDYTLIDNAYNTQGARIADLIATPSAQATAEIAAVPEPATLGVLALGLVGLLGRRRRSH